MPDNIGMERWGLAMFAVFIGGMLVLGILGDAELERWGMWVLFIVALFLWGWALTEMERRVRAERREEPCARRLGWAEAEVQRLRGAVAFAYAELGTYEGSAKAKEEARIIIEGEDGWKLAHLPLERRLLR